MKLSSVPESMRVDKSREFLGDMKSFTGVKESADGEAKYPATAEPAFCPMLQQSLHVARAVIPQSSDESSTGWLRRRLGVEDQGPRN